MTLFVQQYQLNAFGRVRVQVHFCGNLPFNAERRIKASRREPVKN
jgi:hypothetical protein